MNKNRCINADTASFGNLEIHSVDTDIFLTSFSSGENAKGGHHALPGIGLDDTRRRPYEGRNASGLRFCQ
ncbi:hypothetical protein D3C72_2380200 [compost metagenome]